MSILSGLDPHPVWHYFEEICRIPRLSRNEAEIRAYLLNFARIHHLDAREDKAGNVLITKPSAKGFENRKTVVLQSHMDMVGEKNADFPHDWLKDPIVPRIEGGWVTANGTTLGADDGIGIAAQMAILLSEELKSGKIECLFTVDEESGMTGAASLKPGFFDGNILINLDSEDEGILFIGCAGGTDTVGKLRYIRVPSPSDVITLEISITGLMGGHSGDEIHKGFGNSIKLMTRILLDLSKHSKITLHQMNGGNLRNAIPREAFALISTKSSGIKKIKKRIEYFRSIFSEEFGDLERDLKITVEETVTPRYTMDSDDQNRLLHALNCCPHGVLAWSKEMDNLVETSTNLASVHFGPGNVLNIVTTQRSSLESSKQDAAQMTESCFRLAAAKVTHSGGYPGWKPNLRSEILTITRKSYNDLFGKEPLVRAIHAGLECGLIYEKFSGIDMISIGPTIKGAHTPLEKIEIKTVRMFWDLLLHILNNIPEKDQ